MFDKFIKRVPIIPLSALAFYLLLVLLWKFGAIPSPSGILLFLEGLYHSYGLFGLFTASFLEGLVYVGLYFPGSIIVALAVILSDGSFLSLFTISLVVACALTLASIIDYYLGKKVIASKLHRESLLIDKKVLSSELFLSMLHPNVLAFYFFNSGVKSGRFLKLIFVPIALIPYVLGWGYLIYLIKEPIREIIQNPFLMISLIVGLIVILFLIDRKERS